MKFGGQREIRFEGIRYEGYSLKGLFGRFGRLLNKKFFLQVAAGLQNHVNSYGIGFNFSY